MSNQKETNENVSQQIEQFKADCNTFASLLYQISYQLEKIRYLLEKKVFPRDESLCLFDTEADKGKTKGVIIKKLNEDSNLLLAAKVTRALNKEIQDKEQKKTSETMRKQLMSEF